MDAEKRNAASSKEIVVNNHFISLLYKALVAELKVQLTFFSIF